MSPNDPRGELNATQVERLNWIFDIPIQQRDFDQNLGLLYGYYFMTKTISHNGCIAIKM